MKVKIAPSILSADFSRLGEAVKEAVTAGADYIHVDVMDGHFVPNLTIGPLVVAALRKVTGAVLDTHLMIENPDKYIPRFHEAGSDIITVHQEACPQLQKTLGLIRSKKGVRAGVSIRPATPLSKVSAVLGEIDLLLIMTVNPGFGGQAFMRSTLPKIREAHRLKQRRGYRYEIEVDGGISPKSARSVCRAGAQVLVAGNSIFGRGNIAKNIRSLRKATV